MLEVELAAATPGSWCASTGSRAADRSRVKLSLLDLPLLPQELLELVPESLRRRIDDGTQARP